ncbi:undecaprenyldiphospho-muramoylpentapeptide beta-N-acetylglucosaminyltransferase [Candidatus Methylomirabilis sp.]|uniref:undecaprenyldiphospho-muramoylpentapeptide beta-N-acetylglucosaminyltransferase n=1 Tax=Candidatus Methylomirabilis sp. TaxID=2032687 RepID=UPI002A6439D0|nr:undecaprenyldiphospho-muramoylpentapeptide beta-N-acetylglucosaminyltransferase [Candidatus Methylomirabilis sp.]
MKAIITGGGTGGHLFPAIALAEELRSRQADLSLLFVGVEGGVEATLLATRGWDFEGIKASGLQGKRLLSRLRSLMLIPSGLIRSLSILRRFRPDVVVGFGGYASAAMTLSGVLTRVPTVIHEQNALPGLANRWLGRFVDRVAVAFEEASDFFPKGSVLVTGNPVRTELFGVSRTEAATRLGLDPNRFTLLIFGGSQGAHGLNRAVMEALPQLTDERERIQFIHATGPRDLSAVRQGYDALGCPAVVEPFFQAMAVAYAAADLCLCRAGAGTVAELCALGKPSVLVPFPFAANDHQRYNAEALIASGGARMVLDRELSGAAVAELIRTFLRDREGLEAMARGAKALAKPDAAARLADLVTLTAARVPGAKFQVTSPELRSGTRSCGHV